ncbi:MAG: hypothetical protein RSD97_00655 [Lachnospiraceae bacterium]
MYNKNKTIIKTLIVLVVTCIVSLIFAFVSEGNVKTIFSQYIFRKQCPEMSINYKDVNIKGYQTKENHFISETDDPMMEISLPDVDVSRVVIYFQNPLNEDVLTRIYYNDGRDNYNEENSFFVNATKDSTSITLDLYKKNINSLRIDLGNKKDVEFDLLNIVVNEKLDLSFKNTIYNLVENLSLRRLFYKAEIFEIMMFFIGLHFVFNIKQMYNWMFKKRWILAGVILFFLVANKFHGDSLAVYDESIQPGMGSVFVQPLVGEVCKVRSDEYLVNTPNQLAATFDHKFGKYNQVARGTKTLNGISGVYLGFETIGRSPFQFMYAILGTEYAFSFCWYAPIFLGFMVALELMYIISKQNKLISVMGASLQVFSSFFMWWGFPCFLLWSQASIVCAYYFIHSNSKKKKIILGLGVAIAFANYVLTLYPAWIVPMGFVSICFLAYIIYENWIKIKEFKKFEWFVILLSGLFSAIIIISYLKLNIEYVTAIMNTVYPGKRSSTGGFCLQKIFYYVQSFLYGSKDVGNASEASVFLSLFPIPFLMTLYCWIKEKKKDILTGGLLLVSTVFLIYSTCSLPSIISKITLLNYTTPDRLIDIIGLIQIYFIVLLLTRYYNIKKLPIKIGVLFGGATAILCLFISHRYFPGYLSLKWMIVSGFVIAILCTCIMINTTEKLRNFICYCMIGISITTSINVRPISRGLDSLTSKPVANEINKIVDESKNEKWIAYGNNIRLSGYLIACGAPTINSTNIYPNLELWKKLDYHEMYEQIYNRYAHVIFEFTDKDTSFKIGQTHDLMKVELSYKDLKKTDASYILAVEELDIQNQYMKLDKIYDENNCYIYKINYQ